MFPNYYNCYSDPHGRPYHTWEEFVYMSRHEEYFINNMVVSESGAYVDLDIDNISLRIIHNRPYDIYFEYYTLPSSVQNQDINHYRYEYSTKTLSNATGTKEYTLVVGEPIVSVFERIAANMINAYKKQLLLR